MGKTAQPRAGGGVHRTGLPDPAKGLVQSLRHSLTRGNFGLRRRFSEFGANLVQIRGGAFPGGMQVRAGPLALGLHVRSGALTG